MQRVAKKLSRCTAQEEKDKLISAAKKKEQIQKSDSLVRLWCAFCGDRTTNEFMKNKRLITLRKMDQRIETFSKWIELSINRARSSTFVSYHS